ncbi:efflux RND transporter periplasmic adaptor subunit [Paenalcaligenes niemegkensis]|uniref:efflux RND transporter periplasmic adaptor subunit n=1 Tax=Paenalcaligenes niemegkensis TaxID=2895469 RepID=UPI001EE9AD3F|nr:efflux RND transporter periplasmic adaptor subunit [Paenalcaligenes niemegkensis]MCQ9617461.1 efflux RND transporter periplasmic adaptor subunit [Paenalcaligenes niemegkensis]
MKHYFAHPLLKALVIAGSLIVVAGCGQQSEEPPAPEIPEVTVQTITSQSVALTTELAGRTSPYLISEVRPQVGGIVKARLFTEGSDVEAGQTLYEIDPATYRANHNSAKAALAKAQATLKVVSLRAGRYSELVKIDAVSKQDNDQAVAEMRQAEADVASARAALDTAAINLGYTDIKAPISGRIGQSSITPGALLSANQAEPLAKIQQLDPIYIDVTQSSIELLRLRKALASGSLTTTEQARANVKLMLEDGTVYSHSGELQFSDVSVDPGTGMVTLRAVFPNPELQLLPGMYVRALLEEGVREQAILVPQQGVSRDSTGNATALLVNSDGKVENRTLTTVRTIGDQWLVEAGIEPGERVIVEGVQRVRPGVAVNAVEALAPTDAQAVSSAD